MSLAFTLFGIMFLIALLYLTYFLSGGRIFELVAKAAIAFAIAYALRNSSIATYLAYLSTAISVILIYYLPAH